MDWRNQTFAWYYFKKFKYVELLLFLMLLVLATKNIFSIQNKEGEIYLEAPHLAPSRAALCD
jgi:hypothetical protein